MRDDEQSVPQDAPAEKKRYEPPQLIVYGDIREVTQAVLASGSVFDNAFFDVKSQ